MKNEIRSFRSCFRYTLLHKKLRQMGVTTNQLPVRLTFKALDSDGVTCMSFSLYLLPETFGQKITVQT